MFSPKIEMLRKIIFNVLLFVKIEKGNVKKKLYQLIFLTLFDFFSLKVYLKGVSYINVGECGIQF